MAKADDDDTGELFPELNTDKPEHKALMRLAKDYSKAKDERSTLLTTSKEKVDGKMSKLIAQMHECKMTKFRHKGVTVELMSATEKVEVKFADESDGTDDGDEAGDE